jgi:dTDP-4-dehydrorhamnose reductase
MSDAITILVSGSNGQLGSELQEIASQFKNYRFVFLSRTELSIVDRNALEKQFVIHEPSYFINCAAYTAVDKAEEEKELAEEINGRAVGAIAALCNNFNCRLIHISTDYVFNSQAKSPLKEDDPVDPVNAYGETKLMGERLAMQNTDTIIIRTSWVYSKYGKNFVKTMKRLMGEKDSVSVVSDQVGSPTYAADLAEAIMEIITTGKWEPGIYNYSNSGVISWFEFASEIKNLLHSTCEVLPISTAQFPTPAKRPAYSVLDKSKIKNVYNITTRDWKESLIKCINKLESN